MPLQEAVEVIFAWSESYLLSLVSGSGFGVDRTRRNKLETKIHQDAGGGSHFLVGGELIWFYWKLSGV